MTAGIEHADLTFETMHGAIDQRLAQGYAGVVEQIARREVVGAVDHHIHAVEQPFDVAGTDALGHGFDARAWIQCGQRARRGFDLGRADGRFGMQNLPLQVAAVDHVVVGNPQGAHARRGEIVRRWRTQTARADQQHACRFERALPCKPHLRKTKMARIAFGEVRVDAIGRLDQRQPLRSPTLRSARHGDGLGISLHRQRFGGAQRAHAALADQQDFDRAVRQMRGRIGDQRIHRDTARAFRHSRRAFVHLAYVDQHSAAA